MLPKLPDTSTPNKQPRIKRSIFNTVARLRAEGFSWEDIAAEVNLPVAEIKCYPDRRRTAWDEELARNARRATLEGVVQVVAQWRVMMATKTPTTFADLTHATDTLAAVLPLLTPPKLKRKYTPRKPKAKAVIQAPEAASAEVVRPNAQTLLSDTQTPIMKESVAVDHSPPVVETSPAIASPLAPTNKAPTLPQRWFTTLRESILSVRTTLVRWVHALTPRFFRRC